MTRKLPHMLQQRRREKCEGKGEKRRKEEGGKKKERDPEVHPSQPLTWQDLS